MEQDERGYRWADGAICSHCVSDTALASWIEKNLNSTNCRFCGQESDDLIAASFDDFVGIVLAGISFDWNHPDNEGIAYESAEGGYLAELSDSWDVFSDYYISENNDVVEALIDAIDTESWVERDFYIGDDSKRLSWGWDWFKRVTKHQTRYLFLKSGDADYYELPPSRMLDEIATVIGSDLQKAGLIKMLTSDVELIRIRIGAVTFGDAAAIGPPPVQFATQSNRMSPAGIPMFYGAFDAETAQAETFDPNVHTGQIMSIGTFRAQHDLKVLDLADLPDIPSVFELNTQRLIHSLRFLHAFARDIAQPIKRDGREHIEYVPTQIVTEYFRRVFRDADGQPIDGIVYKSSKNGADKALVLFCENGQCVDKDYPGPWIDKILLLASVEYQACPLASGPENYVSDIDHIDEIFS